MKRVNQKADIIKNATGDIINHNATGDIINHNFGGDILDYNNATGTGILNKTFTMAGYNYSYLIPIMLVAGGATGFYLSKRFGFVGGNKALMVIGLMGFGTLIGAMIKKPTEVEGFEPTPFVNTANPMEQAAASTSAPAKSSAAVKGKAIVTTTPPVGNSFVGSQNDII